MLNFSSLAQKSGKFIALTICLTTLGNSFTAVEARPDRYYNFFSQNKPYAYPSKTDSPQPLTRNSSNNTPKTKPTREQRRRFTSNLPAGTVIPTFYPSAEKILVTKEETALFTLEVSNNIRDRSGNVVIPRGSQIIGEIRPVSGGSRFVGETLVLTDGSEFLINANSTIVSRTETVESGRNTDAIWQGAAAGAAAATIIAGVTGDNAIATEEVLGGAGFGALAGFLFGGNRTEELISFDTQTDLDLTLTSRLTF